MPTAKGSRRTTVSWLSAEYGMEAAHPHETSVSPPAFSFSDTSSTEIHVACTVQLDLKCDSECGCFVVQDVGHAERCLSQFLGLTSGALFPDDARHYRVDVLEAPKIRMLLRIVEFSMP